MYVVKAVPAWSSQPKRASSTFQCANTHTELCSKGSNNDWEDFILTELCVLVLLHLGWDVALPLMKLFKCADHNTLCRHTYIPGAALPLLAYHILVLGALGEASGSVGWMS